MRVWTNNLGTCDCGTEVYVAMLGAECEEQTANCKCGRPVCLNCQEARERNCEECGAFVCDHAPAVNTGDYWLCLACIRRERERETRELLGLEVA